MASFPTAGDGWTTRRARSEDRAVIRRLWAETFGDATDARKWLTLSMGDAPAACWVATADGTVIGFVVAAAGDRQFARELLDGAGLAESLPEPIATIQMVGVDPAWRAEDVATALVQRCFDWASDRAAVMLVTLWQRENHVDSTPLAEKFGLEHVRTIPEYYTDRADCPDCAGTCTCPAAVHVRSLDDGTTLDVLDPATGGTRDARPSGQ